MDDTTYEAKFYGLGSDGTVGANKNSRLSGQHRQVRAGLLRLRLKNRAVYQFAPALWG